MVRDLFGLKSSSEAFRSFIEDKLDKIGLQLCVADPDVWLRPATKPYSSQYYEYNMMYMDDILAIYTNTTKILKILGGDTIK